MALSKEDRAEVEGLVKPVADSVTKLTETIATLPTTDKMGEAVKAQVEAATKPLSEAIAKIGTPPAKPGDDKDKNKPGNDGDEMPAWAKALGEKIDKVTGVTDAITAERTEAQQRAASKTLVENTLKEMKRSGLLKNQLVIDRMVAAKPKDAAAVKALFESEQKYAASLGAKPESFGADVAGEGGKTGEGGEGGKQDSEAIAKEILARKTASL